MKRQIALSLALTSLMSASAVFAAPAILNNGPRSLPQHEHQLQQKSAEARVAENGSDRTIDRLHKQMDDVRVAENGSEHTIDKLHSNMVAESGGDTVFDAHLKRVS
ncbi:phage infection protein [Pseudomonas sp. PDM19]|uniref:phage infection protein n=1 Tax=Pseudomonas sp. PDM19 TaxID=2769272 RepID=UPI00177B2550|nr:phage infection protein [Pseudomonas sp. PDM19]MBD9633412.1 phage infection protein [Pseudomonas sp. PDM19]